MVSQSIHLTKPSYRDARKNIIFLRKDLLEDPSFPFKVGDALIIKIEGDKLVIERGK